MALCEQLAVICVMGVPGRQHPNTLTNGSVTTNGTERHDLIMMQLRNTDGTQV